MFPSSNRATLLCLSCCLALSGCEQIGFFFEARNIRAMADANPQDTTSTEVIATEDANGRPATLLSAFFGLDALPAVASRVFCEGGAGQDGMPVIFSHEIDLSTMQAGDFRIVRTSGAVGSVNCVTPAPALDIGERRTVLIIGDYGSVDDQPARVEIVGNLLSIDGSLNFRGTQVEVTPLESGPVLEWAEVVPQAQWSLGDPGTAFPAGGGSSCPLETQQVLRVTWSGGVTKPGGASVDDLERQAYQVTLATVDDEITLTPFAIADLGDADNNHELCLDQPGNPMRVDFPAGLLTDPREDLNPATSIKVTLN